MCAARPGWKRLGFFKFVTMKLLELFAGSRSVGKVAEAKGFTVFSSYPKQGIEKKEARIKIQAG